MEITDVRVRLVRNRDDRLKAYGSITLDDEFVVRDLRVIEGVDGPFVAMPSRKTTARCAECGGKNHLKARFCNDCGIALSRDGQKQNGQPEPKLYADIAHPIKNECRRRIQRRVLAVFEKEVQKSKKPGCESVELDDGAPEILD